MFREYLFLHHIFLSYLGLEADMILETGLYIFHYSYYKYQEKGQKPPSSA